VRYCGGAAEGRWVWRELRDCMVVAEVDAIGWSSVLAIVDQVIRYR
jgi:hypothetical protein